MTKPYPTTIDTIDVLVSKFGIRALYITKLLRGAGIDVKKGIREFVPLKILVD